MEIIEVFREVQRLVVDTIAPDRIRIDPLPTGTFISCGDSKSDIAMSAKLHKQVRGLTESIAFSEPKILSRVLESPDYRDGHVSASFISSGSGGPHFRVTNSHGSLTQLKVLGGRALNQFAQQVRAPNLMAQLVMPISALWKQQFEYWSKFENGTADQSKASFLSNDDGLSCLIGEYNFDHHIWSCERGVEAGFVSAISFQCAPMIKVLKLLPNVRRMSISVSTKPLVIVKADGHNADYTFFLHGEVPNWYQAARLPVYGFDDPRSVMQQRLDEN